mmetsp:Transcript_114694/g.370609  ORF Transcript_114694/g.370609 Transcript_114694/m.370609 type:complete len:275 (+) Transcript_114694:2756-3580(+)
MHPEATRITDSPGLWDRRNPAAAAAAWCHDAAGSTWWRWYRRGPFCGWLQQRHRRQHCPGFLHALQRKPWADSLQKVGAGQRLGCACLLLGRPRRAQLLRLVVWPEGWGRPGLGLQQRARDCAADDRLAGALRWAHGHDLRGQHALREAAGRRAGGGLRAAATGPAAAGLRWGAAELPPGPAAAAAVRHAGAAAPAAGGVAEAPADGGDEAAAARGAPSSRGGAQATRGGGAPETGGGEQEAKGRGREAAVGAALGLDGKESHPEGQVGDSRQL